MELKQFVELNKEEMMKDIISLVNIPSIFNEEDAGEGKPFGSDVARGLEWVLAKANAMGMKTKNYDGYAGEITIGEGDTMIGILAHEDVVAAGEDWETEPFDAVIKDNKIFGRGASDDKGPLVSSLYAMKYLMDEGKIPEGKCLRMIVGTNEEEAWGGINYYVKHVDRLPDYSIVPDGYFPLVYCEKGLLDVDLTIDVKSVEDADVTIEKLYGGFSRNVVPGKAYCVLRGAEGFDMSKAAAELSSFEGISTELKDEVLEVVAQGKSTHAMSPEKGINAVSRLLTALNDAEFSTSADSFLERYCRYIGMTYNGENYGCGFEDELTGKLTFNIGSLEYGEGSVKLEANLRYPASMEKEEVIRAVAKTSEMAGFGCEEVDYLPPVYIKPDSPFVTRLMDVYRNVTGDTEHDAFTIGGATYARAIPNAAAFGPLFPYEEELAHEANEFLDIESLEKMTLIYGEALESLLEMDKEEKTDIKFE